MLQALPEKYSDGDGIAPSPWITKVKINDCCT